MFSPLAYSGIIFTLGDTACLWPYDGDCNCANMPPAVLAWIRCVTTFDPAGPLFLRRLIGASRGAGSQALGPAVVSKWRCRRPPESCVLLEDHPLVRPIDLLHDGSALVRRSFCACCGHFHPLRYPGRPEARRHSVPARGWARGPGQDEDQTCRRGPPRFK